MRTVSQNIPHAFVAALRHPDSLRVCHHCRLARSRLCVVVVAGDMRRVTVAAGGSDCGVVAVAVDVAVAASVGDNGGEDQESL